MKTKVVVTGGAGFIGSNLVAKLVKENFDVQVIDNLSGGKKEKVHPQAKLHVVDIRKFPEILPIFSGAKYVFHLAALPRVQFSIENPKETHDVNVNGTMHALMAAHKAGVKKFIYSASSSAYGDQEEMPLREEMAANPKSPYGLQKYMGELMARLWSEVYGLPTVSLRYFNVYGPGQSEEGAYALVIAKFLKQKREGIPLTVTGDGKQTRDFTSVHDVVRANLLAAESENAANGEVFNIGAGKNYSVNEVAKLIGGKVTHVPERLEPKHTLADNSKVGKAFGWRPEITLEEGIEELVGLENLKNTA